MTTVSVVMSVYNREKYLKEAIDSILNQTYKDFELIIIDDCSTDGSGQILKNYAQEDKRITLIQNETNKGLIYNLNLGISKAKGKYIARMDDDDISHLERFAKQVKYMDSHPQITVLGTYINILGDPDFLSWISLTDSDMLEVAMNFYNPMCHPSIMMRKSFLDEHNLKYDYQALHAEEYYLFKEIIKHGGKLANLPEELLSYRIHNNRISSSKDTSKIQVQTAKRIQTELLGRFYNSPKQTSKILEKFIHYPFERNNKKQISNAIEQMKKRPEIFSVELLNRFAEKFCGEPCNMNIFFAADDNFSQHLAVTMTSILVNSLPTDSFNFYILDGGISSKNKAKLNELKKIKDFEIEFIEVDDCIFEHCPLTKCCEHITIQTYYRYIISLLKPQMDKCFYLDCDIIVEDTLSQFWNVNIKNEYAAVVEELHITADEDAQRLNIDTEFNAGIMLINMKKWKQDNIPDLLFKNTVKLTEMNIIKWQDQDVLNYTFNNKVKFVSPRYNLQINAYFATHKLRCTEYELWYAKVNPVIIHYNSPQKPWKGGYAHPLWNRYFTYLKLSPYHKAYKKYRRKIIMDKLCGFFYKKKVSNHVTRHKVFGVTICKTDKRGYYTKKSLFGIRYYKKYRVNKFIEDKFYELSSQINLLQ